MFSLIEPVPSSALSLLNHSGGLPIKPFYKVSLLLQHHLLMNVALQISGRVSYMVFPPRKEKCMEMLDSSMKGGSEQRTDKARKDDRLVNMPGEDTQGNAEDEKRITQVRLEKLNRHVKKVKEADRILVRRGGRQDKDSINHDAFLFAL